MYLIINPRHDYKIQSDNIIPESWNNLFSIDELVIMKLPIMNFERICISQKYIPQIYTEEIDKKTPLLKIEYCIILCDECHCWIDRKNFYGNCDKCYIYICNECSNNNYNKSYCENCYDYIIDNDSVS